MNAIDKYRALSFKNLSEQDFVLLHHWLNLPHVRIFYQPQPIDLAAVKRKYLPRVELNSPIRCFIIYLDRLPIGYIQTYLIEDAADYVLAIATDRATIDLYIGDVAWLNRGLGWLIELKFLSEIVFQIFSTDECYISHDRENIAALKASKKAGFTYLRNFIEDGKENMLLFNTRANVLSKINYLLAR